MRNAACVECGHLDRGHCPQCLRCSNCCVRADGCSFTDAAADIWDDEDDEEDSEDSEDEEEDLGDAAVYF